MEKKYKTLRKLGQGSYGTVYLVQGSDGVQYALKNIQINPFTKQESKQEVEALKILQHKNFIKIYDYLEEQDSLQILTQFCDGCTLKSFCKENYGKIKDQEIKFLINQIVQAAIYMNDQGVIHRDLKPENILLTNQNGKNIIKICDFGCAKRSTLSDITLQVQSSFEKGTTIYASPEQLNNKSYSNKCDVWSIGCLIHQLIFGQHPYKSDNIEEMKSKMKNSSESSILKLPKQIDPYLKIILKISLKYNQQERATWKELKLLNFFLNNKKQADDYVGYLKKIGEVGQMIFLEVWQGRKELDISKDMKKAYIFFITGFLVELYKMILGILDKSPQFQAYYLNKSIKDDPIFRRQVTAKLQEFKSVYEKVRQYLKQNDHLKRLLNKIPSSRNAMMAHLEYTIKYGKKIVMQVMASKNCQQIFQHSKIMYVLSKWIKFEENFSEQSCMEANDLNKNEVIRNNNKEWVKSYLKIQ